ncbi:TIP41-like protein isoform X2 [Paramacrobiotus metropolitanus]|nr:TIP41-like protein isoform X2 [Paramacrobiotus metropolitanus]
MDSKPESRNGLSASGKPLVTQTTSAAVPNTQVFHFGDWIITITKAPIMSSQCLCAKESSIASIASHQSGNCVPGSGGRCVFCRNEARFTLKYLPDMVFVENSLRIENAKTQSGIEFNAVDAVNSIGEQPSGDIQVASASVWQESRTEALKTYGSKTVQYDWTYTPDYRGSVFGTMHSQPTVEELDLELLKRRDAVLLFDEIQLYGDELDDNGCSEMDLKIRIVDSYVFVLMRFYLRVDHVFVRLYDTRLLLKKGENFMLREYAVRESKIPDLPKSVSPMDPMQIWSALSPLKTFMKS